MIGRNLRCIFAGCCGVALALWWLAPPLFAHSHPRPFHHQADTQTDKQTDATTKRVEVPLVIVEGLPAVAATMGKEVQGRFLISSGSPYSWVTETFVKKYHLTVGHSGDRDFVSMPEFTIGSLTFNTVFFVLPSDIETTKSLDAHGISGELGTNLMDNMAVRIDFSAKKLIFLSPGNLSAEAVKAAGFAAALDHPLLIHGDAFQDSVVSFDFNGRTVEAIWNPSLTYTTLPTKYVPPGAKNPVVQTLKLGGMTLPNTLVWFADDPDHADLGELGMDVQARCEVLIDYPAKKIYLLPADPKNPVLAASKNDSENATDRIVLPFRPFAEHGGPVVTLKIGSKYIGHFLMDTGSSSCLVTQWFSAQAHLKPNPEMMKAAPGIGTIVTMPAELGENTVDVPAIVMEGSVAEKLSEDHIDGILGGNVLEHFAVAFDFGHQTCTLVYPGNLSAQTVKELGFGRVADKAVVLAASEEQTSFLTPVSLNHHLVSLLLDTGSYCTIAPPTLSPPAYKSLTLLGWQSFNGAAFIMASIPVPELSVGDIHFSSFPVIFGLSKDTQNHATLGMDVLAHCDMLIDYPAKKLYLQPTSNYRNASVMANEMAKKGMAMAPFKREGWTILSVPKDGRLAKIGVRTGDVVVAVDGQRLPSDNPSALGSAMIKKKVTTLTLLRNSKKIRLHIPPPK